MVDCTKEYWSDNLKCLYNNICDFPNADNTKQSNINSITRILIFLSLLIMCIKFKYGVIFLFLSLIIIWFIIKNMNSKTKENFEIIPVNIECKLDKCSVKNTNLFYKKDPESQEKDNCHDNHYALQPKEAPEGREPAPKGSQMYNDESCNQPCENNNYEFIPGFPNNKLNPPVTHSSYSSKVERSPILPGGAPRESNLTLGNTSEEQYNQLPTRMYDFKAPGDYDLNGEHISQRGNPENIAVCINENTVTLNKTFNYHTDSEIKEKRFNDLNSCSQVGNCKSTEYGCCKDGVTSSNQDGTNCPPYIDVLHKMNNLDTPLRPLKYSETYKPHYNTDSCLEINNCGEPRCNESDKPFPIRHTAINPQNQQQTMVNVNNSQPTYISNDSILRQNPGCKGNECYQLKYKKSKDVSNENYDKFGIPLNAPMQPFQQQRYMKKINKELYTNVIQQPDKHGKNGVFATTDIVTPVTNGGYNSDTISTGYTVHVDKHNNKYYTHANNVINYNEYKIDNVNPNQSNITDTRGNSYGDPDRCYEENGQVKYYYDDIDSVVLPTYMSSNHVENIYRNVNNNTSQQIDTNDIHSKISNDYVNYRNDMYNSVSFSTVNSLQNISKQAQLKNLPIKEFGKQSIGVIGTLE